MKFNENVGVIVEGMEFKTQISWASRGKSSDFKSGLDYALKKPNKSSALSSYISTKYSQASNDVNTSKASVATYSEGFSHYNNLQKFRNYSGLSAFGRAGSGRLGHQAEAERGRPEKQENLGRGEKRDFYGVNEEKVSEYKERKRSYSERKYIDEVITIATLSKAISVVRKGALCHESAGYNRKLKDFCLMMINYFDS